MAAALIAHRWPITTVYMSKDEAERDSPPSPKSGRSFTEAARLAATAARAERRASAGPFGSPELFVLGAGEHAFTWELRRFGGIVLQRSEEVFPDTASAREAGEKALKVMLATPDLPTFKRVRD